MSKVNLYLLKRACSDLQYLKLYERKYKAATVKRACYLIKKADASAYTPSLGEQLTLYDDLDSEQQKEIDNTLDWSGWYSDSPIGRFFKNWFYLDDRHRRNLVGKLTSRKFAGERDKMDKYLIDYGITDASKRKEIIDDALSNWTSGLAAKEKSYLKDKGAIEDNALAYRKQLEKDYERRRAEAAKYGIKLPKLSFSMDEDNRRGFRGDFVRGYLDTYGGSGRAPNYITDNIAFYHPEIAEYLYRGAGNRGTVNNYFYINGKPVESAASSDTPGLDDITKPTSSTEMSKELKDMLSSGKAPKSVADPTTTSASTEDDGSTLGTVWKNRGFKTDKGEDMSKEQIENTLANTIRPYTTGAMDLFGVSQETQDAVSRYFQPAKHWLGRLLDNNREVANDVLGVATHPDSASVFKLSSDPK